MESVFGKKTSFDRARTNVTIKSTHIPTSSELIFKNSYSKNIKTLNKHKPTNKTSNKIKQIKANPKTYLKKDNSYNLRKITQNPYLLSIGKGLNSSFSKIGNAIKGGLKPLGKFLRSMFR